jgi:hypothetical protein
MSPTLGGGVLISFGSHFQKMSNLKIRSKFGFNQSKLKKIEKMMS